MDSSGQAYDFFSKIYNSATFTFIRYFLAVYVIVLVIDIILLTAKRGFGTNLRQGIVGAPIPKELTSKKSKIMVKWENIKERLDKNKESEYKVAVIEGDQLVDEILGKIGYIGSNLGEKIDNILPGQVENLEELREAHEMRNRIIHDEKFSIDRELAEETLLTFEKFITNYEV